MGFGVGYKGHVVQGSAGGGGGTVTPPLYLEDCPAPDHLALEILATANPGASFAFTCDGVFNVGDRLVGEEYPYGFPQARPGRLAFRFAGSYAAWTISNGTVGPQDVSALPPALISGRPGALNLQGAPLAHMSFTRANDTYVTYQMDAAAVTNPLPLRAVPWYRGGIPADKTCAFWIRFDSLPALAGERAYIAVAYDPDVDPDPGNSGIECYVEADGAGNSTLVWIENTPFLTPTQVRITNWNPPLATWLYVVIQPNPLGGPFILTSAEIWVGTSGVAAQSATGGFGLGKVSGQASLILGNNEAADSGLDGDLYDFQIYAGYIVPQIDEDIYVPSQWDGRGLLGLPGQSAANGQFVPGDVRMPQVARQLSVYEQDIASGELVQLGRFSAARVREVYFVPNGAVPASVTDYWILIVLADNGSKILQSTPFNTQATALTPNVPQALGVDQNQIITAGQSATFLATSVGAPPALGGAVTVEYQDQQV